jgi:hypothetical protein
MFIEKKLVQPILKTASPVKSGKMAEMWFQEFLHPLSSIISGHPPDSSVKQTLKTRGSLEIQARISKRSTHEPPTQKGIHVIGIRCNSLTW